jgi:hypothetical protein
MGRDAVHSVVPVRLSEQVYHIIADETQPTTGEPTISNAVYVTRHQSGANRIITPLPYH